jgi:hypothetical protein
MERGSTITLEVKFEDVASSFSYGADTERGANRAVPSPQIFDELADRVFEVAFLLLG